MPLLWESGAQLHLEPGVIAGSVSHAHTRGIWS